VASLTQRAAVDSLTPVWWCTNSPKFPGMHHSHVVRMTQLIRQARAKTAKVVAQC
jgi:hypothetical protein